MPRMRRPPAALALRPEAFEDIIKLNTLTSEERAIIAREGKALERAMVNYGFSRMEMGKRLKNLRDLLEPHGLWLRLLKTMRFTVRTAYRYIYGYENASRILPEAVLEEAMVRGYRMIGESPETPVGVYTAAVKKLPPPKNPSPAAAKKYLDEVEALRKQYSRRDVSKRPSEDPEDVLDECFRFFDSRLKRLPEDKKDRAKFLRTYVGMQMFVIGLQKATFTAVEVPENMRVRPGAPRGPRK